MVNAKLISASFALVVLVLYLLGWWASREPALLADDTQPTVQQHVVGYVPPRHKPSPDTPAAWWGQRSCSEPGAMRGRPNGP